MIAKNKLIIAAFSLIAIIIALFSTRLTFIINGELIIQILLTLFGIAFALYTFIIGPILTNVREGHLENSRELEDFFLEYEQNLYLIFKFVILILTVNTISGIDIPFLKDPKNIDFGVALIHSLKEFFLYLSVSFAFLMSMKGYLTIIEGTFLIRELLFGILKIKK